MDIEILLMLQNFREAYGYIFTPLMEMMSNIDVFILLPLAVYWCINKRGGLIMMLSLYLSNFAGYVLKQMFFVARPFARDTRIIPLHQPSSYSFPSGHTMIAASACGGLAVFARKQWLSCLCAVVVILAAISRMYLGVHTPQDVIAGAVIALLCVWAVAAVIDREKFMIAVIVAVCAAGLAYLCLKSYPEDGLTFAKRAKWAFFYGGSMIGLAIGHYVERRYINFHETGLTLKGIVLGLIGMLTYYIIEYVYIGDISAVLAPFITIPGGYFVTGLAITFYVVALWPLVIKLATSERK